MRIGSGQIGSAGRRALRIAGGILAMVVVALVPLAIVTHYAGGWGVPYFSFTTDNGSHCTNRLAGYVCDRLTPDDVAYYSDVTFPVGTEVVSGSYSVLHSAVLDTTVRVGRPDAVAMLATLKSNFGKCRDQPSPLKLDGLSATCVQGNGDATTRVDGIQANRLFLIGSGVASDGSRTVRMIIRFR